MYTYYIYTHTHTHMKSVPLLFPCFWGAALRLSEARSGEKCKASFAPLRALSGYTASPQSEHFASLSWITLFIQHR